MRLVLGPLHFADVGTGCSRVMQRNEGPYSARLSTADNLHYVRLQLLDPYPRRRTTTVSRWSGRAPRLLWSPPRTAELPVAARGTYGCSDLAFKVQSPIPLKGPFQRIDPLTRDQWRSERRWIRSPGTIFDPWCCTARLNQANSATHTQRLPPDGECHHARRARCTSNARGARSHPEPISFSMVRRR